MKTGRLSKSVSFEDKERVVRDNLPFDLIQKLDALQNRDLKAYVEFIESDYKNHQNLVSFWEEYIDIHGTPEQINRLLALKSEDEEKYYLKLQHVYRGLVNHAEEV